MDTASVFLELLNSTAFTTGVITICASIFVKVLVNVYKMGIAYRAHIATRQDLDNLRKSMLQDVALLTQKILDARLRDVDNMKKTIDELEKTKIELQVQLKDMSDKHKEITAIISRVNNLDRRLQTIEHNGKDTIRRSE